jgi:hypothetical protein
MVQQFITEARALDVHEMRALKPAKRYTLAGLFIFSQRQKALDDVAEIFIKTVRNLESTAKLRLQQYQLATADQKPSSVSSETFSTSCRTTKRLRPCGSHRCVPHWAMIPTAC